MRGLMVAGAACFALAACNEKTPPPPAEQQAAVAPALEMLEPPPPPPVDCTQLNAVFAAFNERVPFASLRAGEAQPDGRFASAASPANATCTIRQTKSDGAAAPIIHAMTCAVFSSGALDREKNAVPAKAAFDEARRQLDACLPAKWTMRDGAVPEANANEAMIYESEADAQRAMTGSSYTYPVQLKKAWLDGGAGEASGWRVTLDFQKEAAR